MTQSECSKVLGPAGALAEWRQLSVVSTEGGPLNSDNALKRAISGTGLRRD